MYLRFKQILFVLGCSIALFSSTVHAKVITIPKDSTSWRQWARQKTIPIHDLVPLSVFSKGFGSETSIIFSHLAEVSLPLNLRAPGKYQLEICHLTGGNFATITVFLNGKKIGEVVSDGKQVRPIISTFETILIPLNGNKLVFKVARGSDIGLVYVLATLKSYEVIKAKYWRTTSYSQAAYDASKVLDIEKLPGIGFKHLEADRWKVLKQTSTEMIDLSSVSRKGVVCAATHYYWPFAWSGFYLRLTSLSNASVSLNGQHVIQLDKNKKQKQVWISPRNHTNGLNRFVVTMPAGEEAKFTLEISSLAGGKLLATIPDKLNPQINFENWPRATIQNKYVKAVLAIPDIGKGYYRGSRFEQAGILTELHANGHNYFSEYRNYFRKDQKTRNPLEIDNAAGPAEEFYEAIGYGDAKWGEGFIKLGVGIYEKPFAENYFHGNAYWCLKRFAWKTKVEKDQVTYTQEIKPYRGWAYHYTKKIILASDHPGLRIEHTLKNTGVKRLVSTQYNHNFILIDQHLVESGYAVKFGFNPRFGRPIANHAIVKRNLVQLQLKGGVLFTPITGCVSAKQSSITVTHLPTGASVDISGDFLPFRYWFYAAPNAVCVEPFFRVDLAPGAEVSWTRTYRFNK